MENQLLSIITFLPLVAAVILALFMRVGGGIFTKAADVGVEGRILSGLFLRAGVYREYAEKFMRPEQIDAVDIAPYLDSAPQ